MKFYGKNIVGISCLAMGGVALALLLGACKASPVEDSGFLQNPELMKKDDRVPVDRVWKNPAIKASNYDKIIVKPVCLGKQLPKNWVERNNIRAWIGEENQDIIELAQYIQGTFKRAIAEDQNRRFTLTEKPGPKTLVLEMALVKVVTGKPILGAISTAASFTPIGLILIPVKVGAKASADSPTQASMAIEGRIYDSETGRVILMFATNEKEVAAVINFDDMTAFGNLREIADKMANCFVESSNKRPFETGEAVEHNTPLKFINF